jgi:parallel beta-helix repeat protein
MTARTFSVTVTAAPPPTGALRTIYVNNLTGNDSRTITQAQDPATPFATIGRATRGSTVFASPNPAQAAIAGDLVSVAFTGTPYAEVGYRGGTPSENKSNVMLQCANVGTAQNPITIRGTGGRPEIRAATALDRGGVIGSHSRQNAHVIWDNFKVDDTYSGSSSDYGPVILDGTSHVTIQNCEIIGHNGSYFWGHPTYEANYRGIAMEYANFCTIRNNKISRILAGLQGPGRGQNEGGILAYYCSDNLIEQNTIFNCGAGVFLKGGTLDRNLVRRNLVTDCTYNGIRSLDGDDCEYAQNLVLRCQTGIMLGWSSTNRIRVFNNTIHGGPEGMYMLNRQPSTYLYNNLFTSNTMAHNNTGDAAVGDYVANRNLYNSNGSHVSGSSYSMSYAQWQAAGQDVNGSTASPQYVNAAAGNFRLQAGSPALTLGRDYFSAFGGNSSTVIPAGAYVTGTEQIGTDW